MRFNDFQADRLSPAWKKQKPVNAKESSSNSRQEKRGVEEESSPEQILRKFVREFVAALKRADWEQLNKLLPNSRFGAVALFYDYNNFLMELGFNPYSVLNIINNYFSYSNSQLPSYERHRELHNPTEFLVGLILSTKIINQISGNL